MRNRFLKTALVLSAFILTLACSTDDHTGDSTQTPSNPSLSVTLGFANTQTLIEQEASFPFTVSISEPQIVSVVVYLTQTGGTADSDDFSIPASVTIPAGATSASGTIDIHADELAEDTETAVITIATGNESNVQVSNSQTVTFNIANLVEGDLQIGLLWDTLGYQFPDGSEFDPTVLADLRLLITDVPYTTALNVADGSGFESTTLSASDPDGEYYVVADWFAAYDLGDQGFFPLNLTATFDQVGVINDMELNFANALNSASTCSAVHYILAKITKSGENYTIESEGRNGDVNLNSYVGTWSGMDANGYPTHVVTTLVGDQLYITGMAEEWMVDFWGEVIITQATLPMNVDLSTGEFTIDEALYMTTTYLGDPQPQYNLSAVGQLDPCGGAMFIDYDLIQNGVSFENDTPYGPFNETITLN